MNTLLGVAEWWSRTFWALSWQIGILVGLVWLASLLFRRASPNFRYLLWCIVLVRLCFPINLALPAGVSGDVRHAVETSVPAAYLAVQQAVEAPVVTNEPVPEFLPEAPPLPPKVKLAMGWAAVSLSILLLVFVKHLRMRRALRSWREAVRRDLLLLVDSLRSRCAITRAVRVRMFPAEHPLQGPAVVGIVRPTILLPVSVAEDWSLDELEPVLLHELAHIKRWDLLVNLVQMIVQAVYFFHPLVWLANARIRQERELVCDDLAVLHSGGRCKRYSQSFVRVLEETASDAPFLQVADVGMMERRKPLACRIVRMMSKDYRIHRPLGWLSIALLLALSAATIAIAAERAATPNAPASNDNAVPATAAAAASASTASPPVFAEGFAANLPDGRNIQLVSVREHKSGNNSSWRPDGTPLSEAPYNSDELNESVAAPGKGYEFAFRTKGMPAGEPTQYHFEGSTGWAMAGSSDHPDLTVATVFLDAKARSENISVSVVSGDWTTVMTEEPQGGGARGAQEYSAIFGETYEKDGAACITVTLEGSLSERAVRLCAVDKDGGLHPSSANVSSVGKARQGTHKFAGLKPQEIKEFQLQTRPWQEIRFENISLVPGQHTDF